MHIAPIAALLLALPLLAAAAPVHAEHLRFELGAGDAAGVPRTFERLRGRIDQLGFDVTWEDAPYFDPGYTTGGATYASITFEFERDSVTLTWTEFRDEAACATHEQDFIASYGTRGWVRFVRDGRVFLQAYSNGGDSDLAGRALDRVVGG